MRSYVTLCVLCSMALTPYAAEAQVLERFSKRLCAESTYECRVVRRHETWSKLFPQYDLRHFAQCLNRRTAPLRPGLEIAVPTKIDWREIAPHNRDVRGSLADFPDKVFTVNLRLMVWHTQRYRKRLSDTASLVYGEQVGPISAGRHGVTPTSVGEFRVRRIFTDKIRPAVSIPGCANSRCWPETQFVILDNGVALRGHEALPGIHVTQGEIWMDPASLRQLIEDEYIEVGSSVVVMPY